MRNLPRRSPDFAASARPHRQVVNQIERSAGGSFENFSRAVAGQSSIDNHGENAAPPSQLSLPPVRNVTMFTRKRVRRAEA